jgi:hypothetical protein
LGITEVVYNSKRGRLEHCGGWFIIPNVDAWNIVMKKKIRNNDRTVTI